MSDPRTPVTLITGFLGAGKTSLVNRVLAQRSRVAVIVNELGDVGVDGVLIQGAPREELVELNQGCACCTVRGDLRDAARALLARGAGGLLRRRPFAHLLVETSGVANPGPILQTFVLDPVLADTTRIDGVICVADATHLPSLLADLPEARSQVGYADRVLLNHADRATPAQRQAAHAAIHAISSAVTIEESVRAEVPVADILDVGGTDPARWDLDAPACHTPGVGTLTLRATHAIEPHRLEIWLRFIVGRRTWEIMRLKGLARCVGFKGPVVAQAVYQYLELSPASGPPPAETAIVIIGRDLDEAEIRRGWARVIA